MLRSISKFGRSVLRSMYKYGNIQLFNPSSILWMWLMLKFCVTLVSFVGRMVCIHLQSFE